MKNQKLLMIAIVIAGLLCSQAAFSQDEMVEGDTPDPNIQAGVIMDFNVAKRVAIDELRKSYIGQLGYFAHFILYDLDHEPLAYAIVFSKVGIEPNSLGELEAYGVAIRSRISSLHASKEQISKNNEMSNNEKNQQIATLQEEINIAHTQLSGEDSFVTVVTGAKDTMPTILKQHQGLPVAFIGKVDAHDLLRRKYPNIQWIIDRPLYLSSSGTVFEALAVSSPNTIDGVPMAVERVLVDVREGLIRTTTDFRNAQERVDLAREENKKRWKKFERNLDFPLNLRQPDLPAIVQQAGVILKGKVLYTQSQWVTDERGKHIYTSVTMHVDKRLKGEILGDQISFEVVGGTVDDITEVVSDSHSFRKEEEAIVFLKVDPYRSIRGGGGKYQIYDGKVYVNNNELTVDRFMQTLQILNDDSSAIISLAEEEELTIIPTDEGGGQLPPDQLPEIEKKIP